MKPTIDQFATAVAELGILRYFPSDPLAQKAIIKFLERMVGTIEQLNWLVSTLVDRVGTWEGPVEARGIFCTRYQPADGIEANSNFPGFTPADSEMSNAYLPPARHEIGAPCGMKLLDAPDEEAALENALGMPAEDAKKAFSRLRVPTFADREYSRKLLEHLT